jgi:hypothetical protein
VANKILILCAPIYQKIIKKYYILAELQADEVLGCDAGVALSELGRSNF